MSSQQSTNNQLENCITNQLDHELSNESEKEEIEQNKSKNSSSLNCYSHEEFELLTKKIKAIEKSFEPCLTDSLPCVLRLDGCSFKNFTKGLKKPFDERLTRSLIKTTEQLITKMNACIGYCQSDEITLVINPKSRENKEENVYSMIHNGRIQKLCSTLAAFASIKFNQFIQSENWDDVSEKTREKMMGFNACFDCRLFSVPDEKTAMEVIYWRHHFDCRRNSVNMIGHEHFSNKQLNNVSVRKLIEKLKSEKNVEILRDYNHANIFGSFSKKNQFNHIGYDPIKKENIETTRTRVESRVLDMSDDENERIRLLFARYWNDLDNKVLN